MIKNTVSFSLLVFAVFLFAGCGNKIVFDEKVVFPDNNWTFEKKAITFTAPLKGSEDPHTIIVELELLGTPNVNLINSTFTIVTPKGGKTVKKMIFNFLNPREPYIKGASANEKIYRLTIYPKKYFSETGDYTFEVNQFSNKADNYGIRALRLYIVKGKKEKISE
jgi:hypothetical protein